MEATGVEEVPQSGGETRRLGFPPSGLTTVSNERDQAQARPLPCFLPSMCRGRPAPQEDGKIPQELEPGDVGEGNSACSADICGKSRVAGEFLPLACPAVLITPTVGSPLLFMVEDKEDES